MCQLLALFSITVIATRLPIESSMILYRLLYNLLLSVRASGNYALKTCLL